MSLGTLGLAFLAGALSVLSPCVLPLLPIMVGSAGERASFRAGRARRGAFALVRRHWPVRCHRGVCTGFFRLVSAILLIAVGTLLLVPRLGAQAAAAGGPVSNWVEGQLGGFATHGLGGQFLLGLLLGAVWSPCVGPTLGAASILAAKGENLGEVALTMVAFGIGAAVPLIAIGLLSREALSRWRGWLMEAGKGGKVLLGGVLVAIGLLVATGLDKRLETLLVDASPAWLTRLTTTI